MVGSRQEFDGDAIEVTYAPPRRHRALPVEVVDRSSILARLSGVELAERRERVGFHLLVVCTSGHGSHVVDYQSVEVSAGTCLRVYPGQVQQHVANAAFEAHMVVWPTTAHPVDPQAPPWFPGCGAATSYRPDDELFDKILGSVEEFRYEQDRFDGSPRKIGLLHALLSTLLLRIAAEIPESSPDASRLPQPYLDFRAALEKRLYARPAVVDVARELGYSSRTLDRACQQVTGKTAKQVSDERVALEIRRLLTHTDDSIARIGVDFGFYDPSNFSKFVKRHLGGLPGEIRDRR